MSSGDIFEGSPMIILVLVETGFDVFVKVLIGFLCKSGHELLINATNHLDNREGIMLISSTVDPSADMGL